MAVWCESSLWVLLKTVLFVWQAVRQAVPVPSMCIRGFYIYIYIFFFYDPEQTWTEVHTNLFDYTENYKHPCPWSMYTEGSKRQITDTPVARTKRESNIIN